MSEQVLVTGGTGYIGSHTAVELIESGYEVLIIDNLSNSRVDVLDGIEQITGVRPEFYKIDLRNTASVDTFFENHRNLKAIIHFAAFKSVNESVNEPLKYYENNLFSLVNLLKGMLNFHLENILFSSSCTVYGQPDSLPVTEKAPFKKAMSPYGHTKQISEDILRETASYNKFLKCISLRYFNPIGAHPSALIGEIPQGVPDNLVPYITQTAVGLRKELNIYGDDYQTPDGSCIRDYIDIVDLAKAHVFSVQRLIENRNRERNEIFNLGTGSGVSVLELVKTFIAATGVQIKYRIAPRRPGDIEKVWADPSYAEKELGWKASVPLADSLLSAYKWEQHVRKRVPP